MYSITAPRTLSYMSLLTSLFAPLGRELECSSCVLFLPVLLQWTSQGLCWNKCLYEEGVEREATSSWAPFVKVPQISLYFPGENWGSRTREESRKGEEERGGVARRLWVNHANCSVTRGESEDGEPGAVLSTRNRTGATCVILTFLEAAF